MQDSSLAANHFFSDLLNLTKAVAALDCTSQNAFIYSAALLIRLCFLLLSLSLAALIQVIGIVLVRLFMLSKALYFMMYYLPDLNEI